jgi:aryl-alcohol dehydrogenase-like predicted oxidoreductase
MRRVKLSGTDIECSALGFGCANLMGRYNRRESLRALEHAFDLGVTLFDTARSYGWGRSEEVLGEFLKNRRARVTVVTKLGIFPPQRSLFRELARPAAQRVLGIARKFRLAGVETAVRGSVKAYATATVRRGQFDAAAARLSLETSLRALAIDSIDILLLHSPLAEDLADGALLEFLEGQVRRGVVRAIGVASSEAICHDLARRHPNLRVLEYPLNLLHEESPSLEHPVARLTHSPFGGSELRPRLQRLLDSSPDQARHWSDQVGFRFGPDKGLDRLLLRAAIHANPHGAVLCGMHSPDHIRDNVRITTDSLSLDQALPRIAREVRLRLAELEL